MQLSGLFDWVTSPVDSAQAQWAAMIADWDNREAQAQANLDELDALGPAVADMGRDAWEQWAAVRNDGVDKLANMRALDNAANTVKGWFAENPQALGTVFPPLAAAAVVAAAAAFAAVGYWNARAVEYIANAYARYKAFQAAKAAGDTDAEAIAAANAIEPAVSGLGSGGSGLSEWLLIGVAVFLLFNHSEKH